MLINLSKFVKMVKKSKFNNIQEESDWETIEDSENDCETIEDSEID